MGPREVFLLTSAVGALWFLLKERRTDFFTIGFFSGLIYFMPGFVGVTVPPHLPDQPMVLPLPMDPNTYWVMSLVLVAILVGAMAYDRLFPRLRPFGPLLHGAEYSPSMAVLLAALSLLVMVGAYGPGLLVRNKQVLLHSIGYLYLLWSYAISIAALLCIAFKRYRLASLLLPMFALDLYLGFRQTTALVFISVLVLWISGQAKQRLLIVHWRKAAIVLFGGFFFFMFGGVKILLYNKVSLSRFLELLTIPDYYVLALSRSEPFGVQNTLSAILAKDFHVSMDHLMGIVYLFVPFAPNFGIPIQGFNDLFQPKLFPGVDYGLGSNVWAEMWSSGGNPLLVAFVAFYVFVLGLGSYMLLCRDSLIKCGIVLSMSYWAFYIHRNDLLTETGLEKRIAIVWILVALASMIMPAFARRPAALKAMEPDPG